MPGDRIVLERMPADSYPELSDKAARGELVAEPIL